MRVIVVGGGAAGMMAAIAAAEYGSDVTILERNEKLGKKIYITGKGRCNLTNACDPYDLMKHIVHNPKFMYSAFNAWNNHDMVDMIEAAGCMTKTERGGRVFPVSDHASDVIKALKVRLDELKVSVILNTHITRLMIKNDRIEGVISDSGQKYAADRVILATGGASYKTTGSDGTAFDMVRDAGHSMTVLKPSLVPLICADKWMSDVQGLSLKNVTLTLYRADKKIYSELGEMLFTGRGISGPIGLSASSFYEPADTAMIDLKPGLDEARLDERLQRDFAKYINKDYINSLNDLLPKSLIPVIVTLSGIEPDQKVHQITGKERMNLNHLIKHLTLDITGTAGFDEAIITRGGISTKEIDPSTMRSRLIDGLSFAGEMIDVDALTGGFNLQIAWSSGYLAGIRAGE